MGKSPLPDRAWAIMSHGRWALEQAADRRLPSPAPSGCSSTARAPAFQAGGAGSIPVTRSTALRSSPPPRNVHLNTAEKLILGAVAVVFAAGVGLAIAQPGDLGDDDDEGAAATTTSLDDGGTTTTGDETTTTPTTEDSTTTSEDTTTTTVGDTTTSTAPPTTTTTVDSGVSGSGSDSDGGTDGELADSGGEDLAVPALGALGLALALGRLRGVRRPS